MKCIYHAFISHVSRYSLDQKKVSSRSRLGHSRVSSRSRLGQFGKRLGLVSVSGAQVSVLVSVSTQKVLWNLESFSAVFFSAPSVDKECCKDAGACIESTTATVF